ncbi:MAG: ABC transporter permease, partial [Acidobacteriota bacterium]
MSALSTGMLAPVRRLWREPLSALLVVAILGLTMGATALVFTLVDALLLDPLPFAEPDRLVLLEARQGGVRGELSMRELRDIEERTDLFADIAAYKPPRGGYTMGGDGSPVQAPATLVTHNLFSVLGVAPAIGSSFPAAFDLERSFGIVMSQRLYRAQLGGDAERLDQVLTLDGAPNYRVFGVLPAGFDFPIRTDLYRSIYINERNPNLEDRSARVVLGVARLAPGVGLEGARVGLASLSNHLAEDHPDTNRSVELRLMPLEAMYTGDLSAYLWILGFGVATLLAIGCVVTSNLLLTRALPREAELALRAALGASRLRLSLQILADGILLCSAGAVLGLGLADLGLRVLSRLVRFDLPTWRVLEIDTSTLAFLVGIACLTALASGALPAWRLSHASASEVLRAGGRSGALSRQQRRASRLLVTLQGALAFVLVAVTVTLVDGFRHLERADVGFAAEQRLSFKVNLPWFLYSRREPAKLDNFHREVLAQLEALPAVEQAALTTDLPFTEGAYGRLSPFHAEGQDAAESTAQVRLRQAVISPSLFDVLDMPLLEGRAFGLEDRADGRPVAIVSQLAADRLWPGQRAIGQRLRSSDDPEAPWLEVVGVVGDVRRALVASVWQEAPALYIPAAQDHPRSVHFVLAASGSSSAALKSEVARVVHRVDPLQPIWDIETMTLRRDTQLWREQSVAGLVSVFALVAVLLAAGGLYAVLAQSVRHRRHEIGVRMALGADRRAITRLVTGDAGRMLLPATAFGALVTFGVFGWLASLVPFFDLPSRLSLAGTALGLAA